MDNKFARVINCAMRSATGIATNKQKRKGKGKKKKRLGKKKKHTHKKKKAEKSAHEFLRHFNLFNNYVNITVITYF